MQKKYNMRQTIQGCFKKAVLLFRFKPLIFVAIIFSLSYGLVTVIIGCAKLSYFIGITGTCALIFGITKLYALNKYFLFLTDDGNTSAKDNAKIENNTTKNIATYASVMAFLHFSIAVVCTFFEEESPSHYELWFMFFAILAAFVKILLASINAVLTKKSKNITIHNIKLVDTANALISLGLTQRAILYYAGNENARFFSGLGGMFFSLCALCVCLVMFLNYKSKLSEHK